jgi:phospholipase C
VDPEHSTGIKETSEHPPANMQHGQRWLWEIVDAFTKSPIWNRAALFIAYDEHGGFADHAPPPPACHPGTGDPEETGSGTFDRYGIRVPVYVVSAYAKRHYVSHVTHDHTSILRFVQARFGLPALSNRDANADAMMDMFDFEAGPQPPPTFPEPPVDPAKVAECDAAFPFGN